MRRPHILPGIALILLLTICAQPGFSEKKDKRDDKKSATAREQVSLEKSAQLKKEIFGWLWKQLKDNRLAEMQIETLREERMKIERAVRKLEFLVKLRKKPKESNEANLVARQENSNTGQ